MGRFYTGAPQRQSGCVPRQAFRGRHARIPENGVEDREKLPHHCNEGDLLGSAMGSELVVEGPKRETAPDGSQTAMYSTARTDVRPPAMALRPRIRPKSRLIGATPTRAAT